MDRVLVFSGTAEGRSIVEWLCGNGADPAVKVATEYGAHLYDPSVDVSVGSCGGAAGIAKMIEDGGYSLVIDCTHPYASTISGHIREACEVAHADLMRVVRPEHELRDVIAVESIAAAVDRLMETEGAILVTTGIKEASEYTRIPGFEDRVHLRILPSEESVRAAMEAGFRRGNLFCAQGPFTTKMNEAMMEQINAKYLVTKESGDAGGFEEKLLAANHAGAKTIVVTRPSKEEGMDLNSAMRVLSERLVIPLGTGKRTVNIIGIGMGGETMTVEAVRAVESSDVLIGSRRMIDSVDSRGKAVFEEYRPDEVLRFLDDNPCYRTASVLMSGDVGFFSGATGILERMGAGRYAVRTFCGLSSSTYFFSRIGRTWQDAYLMSAHGRGANVPGHVRRTGKVFTLLSGDGGAAELCEQLIEYGLGHVSITIGSDLGTDGERIVEGSPEELRTMRFSSLSVALVENPEPIAMSTCVPDDLFVRGRAPMTKSEVRCLSVSKLRVERDSIVYDIGAGTGSVSVELAMAAVDGEVYAIEADDDAAELVESNRRRFSAPNIKVVRGMAPDCMKSLPTPTHAFIGGSSGNMRSILETLIEKNRGIRIVINTVTIESLGEAASLIKDLGLVEEEITEVCINRTRRIGGYHIMDSQNPVHIIVVRGQ